MTQGDEIKLLEEQESAILANIRCLMNEAIAVIGEDLAKFPEREVRRHFTAFVEFAETVPEQKIKEIKKEIAGNIATVAQDVIDRLSDETLWFAGVEFDGEGKSLMENVKLWESVRPVAKFTEGVLRRYKFPLLNPGTGVEYKAPTWFISGKFLPAIAEKYWKAIGELKELRKRMAEHSVESKKKELLKKWDSI
ncbi:MAG: hypothetical protein FJ088_00880 [Deltaproteobacteria bacterium]|nr:hypothetical protein [Deltaproteobacteria bacterium]